MDATPLDKLKTTTLGDLTQDQIHDTAASTFVSRPGATRIARDIHEAKLAIATFGSTIIPSGGGIESAPFTDAPPTGSQLAIPAGEVWLTWPSMWRVVNAAGAENDISIWLVQVDTGTQNQIGTTTTVAASAQDGAAVTSSTALPLPSWFKLNSNLTLSVVGTQSGISNLKIPYQLEAM